MINSKSKFFKNNLLSSIISHALKGRDFILDLIFPVECLGCGHEGVWLCPECHNKLKCKSFNSCFGCKRKNLFGEFCPSCRQNFCLDGIWIAGDYDNQILSALIKLLKYHFITDISIILGNFISRYLQKMIKCETTTENSATGKPLSGYPFIDKNKTVIIPVPLHKKRERWRGFNQARALARVIALNFDIRIDAINLLRVKNNPPQAKLNENQRQKNILGCFAWQGQNLKGQTVILVDDIATTGATLNECAKVLKAAGANEVWGLVVAKG